MREYDRLSNYSVRKLRGDKKTIRVKGSGEDADRYFRCWNCGFVCDSQRDSLGERGGVTTGTYTDVDAVVKYYPIVTGGCPNCGCTNYK